MEEITLFIITTIYNARSCLQKTLDSLLLQTRTNFIHYIYDDASTVGCEDIINTYIGEVRCLEKPYKVVYEKGNKNLGCDKAHEYAFKRMEGTHVLWLDAGDYFDRRCIEVITASIERHRGYNWFHLNSIHYDINTSCICSKKSSKKYKLKYLKQHNQLPCWVFGDFYYHTFVINIDTLKSSFNGNINIIDKNEHGGCFYDAQIVLRLLALGQKMFFIRYLCTFIMVNDKSIASSFKGDSQKADICIRKILDSDETFSSFSQFYYPYSKAASNVVRTRLLCKNKKAKDAKNYYNEMISFLNKNNKSIHKFFLHKWKYRAVIFLSSLPFFNHLI